jgi:pimeloyl-ACP methyl ester carboxylesterase
MTVPYPALLARALPESWSLAQTLLTSSYGGWGTSSLKSDAAELHQCVKYFRGVKSGKIVLMGHSTGCQDVMEYLVGPSHADRPLIDGAILQAPVSDREASLMKMSHNQYAKCVAAAQVMVREGKAEEIMPISETHEFFGAPITARRCLSLLSPDHDGEDDYFSSDLPDTQLNRTFGMLPAHTPLCILYSGADEHVPPEIDKMALVTKWIKVVQKHGKVDTEHSGVIDGASHSLKIDSADVVADLLRRVMGFLGGSRSSASL